MIGKTRIVFSLLLASFLLIGMASATTCTPESYNSGWLEIVNYADSYSGNAGIYNGNWYVDDNTGIVTIETPSLSFGETYTLYVKYGIGTGNDLTTEDFQVVCGGQTNTFLDSILIDDPQTLIDSMSCTLTSGYNYFDIKSINTGSVHLYKFKLIGEKTCPTEPTCGDGIENQVSEECDLGVLNGQVCDPIYGDSCEWCTVGCLLETEIGEYCGDTTCQSGEGETCSTCETDCGVCPPGPTCGDGVENQISEECDWGILNGQVCDPVYGGDCDWCTVGCLLETEVGEYCGDTTCNGEETCSTCETDCGVCPVDPVCGDGIRQGDEECDDGNTEDDDGCSSECEKERDGPVKKPLVVNTCNPDWKCGGWSECSGGVMTRTCFDNNHCEVQYNEPYTTSACDMVAQSKEPIRNNLFWFFLGIVLLILLLIILVNLLR